MSASITVPDGWFEGPEGEKALDRAHAYGVSWQREGEEVFGPAYLLEAVAAIRRLREVRALPDREAIADVVQDHQFRSMALEGASLPRCRCGIELPSPSRMAHADHLTDVLLGLFGQEGQR